jgi:hypothetical protein
VAYILSQASRLSNIELTLKAVTGYIYLSVYMYASTTGVARAAVLFAVIMLFVYTNISSMSLLLGLYVQAASNVTTANDTY